MDDVEKNAAEKYALGSVYVCFHCKWFIFPLHVYVSVWRCLKAFE